MNKKMSPHYPLNGTRQEPSSKLTIRQKSRQLSPKQCAAGAQKSSVNSREIEQCSPEKVALQLDTES